MKDTKEIGIAYETKSEVVVVGYPVEDESLPEEKRHNCDQMGCGLNHVLYRFRKEAR